MSDNFPNQQTALTETTVGDCPDLRYIAGEELEHLRTCLQRAEELLNEAEPEVWATCGCEPKKPEWWTGDQWELRPYESRAAERTRRCQFHKDYDAFLGESHD